MIALGFTLQPDEGFLDLLADLIEHVPDVYEVAPETLWYADEDGTLHPNGFFQRFAELQQRTGKPCVAHGVGLSVGSASTEDGARFDRWLDAIARTHHQFDFRWYTDHHGLSAPLGQNLAQPMPLPPITDASVVVAHRLQRLRQVVPEVGVENTVTCFTLGDPLDEPAHLRRTLDLAGGHLLLDLHNVYTMGLNLGFDPRAWLDQLDLRQVIEIHISGGAESPPGWLPEGRTVRLDAHSDAIPEPVWDLLEWVLPRCPHLQLVNLERMEGTVTPVDVPVLYEEMARARSVIDTHGTATTPRHPQAASTLPSVDAARWARFEQAMLHGLCATDPTSKLLALWPEDVPGPLPVPAQHDGIKVASLLVAHLRFGRLMRGSGHFEAWFDADPADFTAAFRRYHLTRRPEAYFPTEEARDFHHHLMSRDDD
ncbi:MAG: DUF692 family multinuclear iron-containing protein [Bradymonadia bacterium]